MTSRSKIPTIDEYRRGAAKAKRGLHTTGRDYAEAKIKYEQAEVILKLARAEALINAKAAGYTVAEAEAKADLNEKVCECRDNMFHHKEQMLKHKYRRDNAEKYYEIFRSEWSLIKTQIDKGLL